MDNFSIDNLCINTMRTLAADAIQKAKSGHPGAAIACSPLVYTLYNKMRINPKNPKWEARDRFVLSAGHASMLLYSVLHINGFDVSVEDIKNFRQLGSKTPGHPESYVTPGVDASTGPLGQGFAMAVGMAMAEAHEAAVFNHDDCKIIDNYTYCLMGDGCMMEGISHEAASLAGHLKLHKLIAIYDSNSITIEGSTDIAFSENVAKRFDSYGFGVITVEDGESISAISNAIDLAKADTERPSLIIVKTHIAQGTLKVDSAKAHGEPLGDDVIADMKQRMNWNYPPFTVPNEVYEHFEEINKKRAEAQEEYELQVMRYEKKYPEDAKKLAKWRSQLTANELFSLYDMFDKIPEKAEATRSTSGTVLNMLYSQFGFDNLFGGSADLGPSNKTVLKDSGFFSSDDYTQANIHFGIRELAMAAICNGMMLYGGVRAYCATFMVFSDYIKPALRLSALMELPVIYVFTHDSIGVGEDGPTHHPIEQLSSLRATPGVTVFRPADYAETVAGYITALSSNQPTVLALSRQNLPQYEGTGADAACGAYIVRDCKTKPDVILMASGSELELIYKAYDILTEKGIAVRLVSVPSFEIFDTQDDEYKELVLPKSVKARVSVEAGSTFGWSKYVGDSGVSIGIDQFGTSAPASVLFNEFGFTVDNVVEAAEYVIKINK